jgi:hypothetical protein
MTITDQFMEICEQEIRNLLFEKISLPEFINRLSEAYGVVHSEATPEECEQIEAFIDKIREFTVNPDDPYLISKIHNERIRIFNIDLSYKERPFHERLKNLERLWTTDKDQYYIQKTFLGGTGIMMEKVPEGEDYHVYHIIEDNELADQVI